MNRRLLVTPASSAIRNEQSPSDEGGRSGERFGPHCGVYED